MSRIAQLGVLLALLAANLYWSRPHYNWDMVAYIGVAFRFAGASDEVAHERTYRALRQSVPAEDYELLTQADAYRRTVAADYRAFAQQLPFYSVKPIYPLKIALLTQTGVDPVRASVIVSGAAYLLIGAILFLWLSSFLRGFTIVAVTWVIMSLPFMLDLARGSTPDAMSTAVVLTALWLLMEKEWLWPALALLVVSIGVRPDNLLWVFAIAGYAAVRLRNVRVAALFSAAGTAVYLLLASWSDNAGWRTLFHHSFVERLAFPQDFEPVLTVPGYVWIYLRESHPVNLPTFLLLMLLIAACIFVGLLRRHGRGDARVVLLAAMGGFAVLHWLVYPGEDRFMAAAYAAVLVLLVRALVHEDPSSHAAARPPAHPASTAMTRENV
ncbi:MAG: hypothetical protein WEF86_01145 [Gemmatimonadota bacterium]